MRVLMRIIEEPRECSYLPAQLASLDVRMMMDVSPKELEALLSRGWRRFGSSYFRPQCRACHECVGLRIVVQHFVPSRSQRRACRSASRLRRVVSRPQVDDARLSLYARWHASREGARGWNENPMDAGRYASDFAFPHPCAREAAFYDGDHLVGLGLYDETPNAISAVYFYYEPDFEGSLGTANVMTLIEDSRNRGIPYVYMGYRVEGCASLTYKSAFQPHELLVGRPAMNETPVWIHPLDTSSPATSRSPATNIVNRNGTNTEP
jgi:arginyl-tRNA--protein-N-Asp/Glu arginylyltransferase